MGTQTRVYTEPLEEEAATAENDDESSDELQKFERISARWENNVDSLLATWEKTMKNKWGVGCGRLGKQFKDKVTTFRENVKQFDKAVSPSAKKARLAILATEREEIF